MAYYKYDGTLAISTAAPVADFYGTSGVDTLTGSSAAESFWGGQGDRMVGGLGDDTYYLKSLSDVVVEASGAGIDRIVAWQNVNLARYANVENVSVSGDGLYAAGTAADNIVEGGAGREQIYGGGGQDVLVGGAGADVFIVYKGEGNDVIQDFNAAEDRLRLKAGYTTFAQVQAHLSQAGADVKLDLGDGEGLIFRNLTLDKLTAANFQLQLDVATLGGSTFTDEFSGPLSIWDRESNPTGLWRPDYGYQGSQGVGSYTLVGNNELQIYTSPYFRDHAGDFAESPFVANPDGTLSIWARPSSNPEIFGYQYSSGLLTTQSSFAQTYGYFEMRADLPQTAGAWPAFWLLPQDGSWPPELDVMEVLTQDPNATWTTAHSGTGGTHTSSGLSSFTPETTDGFHTYGVLWTATDLTWYVDQVEVFRTATPADMNKPMFMLANLALGGWAGAVDAAGLPAELRIDYIRAYALPGTASPPPPPPAPNPIPPPPAYANALYDLPVTAAYTKTFLGGNKPDTLNGTTGADFLDGGGNSDVMKGGSGDDTYAVDRATDSAVELANGGIDTVRSTSASFTLSANVENLTLVGSGGQAGTGNELNNILRSNDGGSTLSGGAGDDILVAGRGADLLTGGAGRDIFDFDRVPTKPGHVTDFTLGSDMLDLRSLFRLAGYTGSSPVADGYLAFKAVSGGTAVWFDADGAGPGASAMVTILDNIAPSQLTAQNDWFFS